MRTVGKGRASYCDAEWAPSVRPDMQIRDVEPIAGHAARQICALTPNEPALIVKLIHSFRHRDHSLERAAYSSAVGS